MEERAEGLPAPRGLCRGAADAAQRESPLVESTSITHPSPLLGAGPAPGKPWLPRAPLIPGSHRGPVLTSAPFPRSPARSPADLTGLNTQRGQPSNSWHRSALQKREKCCVDFAGSLQHLGEVTALPFSLTPLHLNSWRVYHMVFQLTPTKAVPRPQQIQKH